MLNPIINLHLKNPEIYDEISSDRNFRAQCEQLIRYSQVKPCSTLELFSGAGRHSDSLKNMGVKRTYCVDASEAARNFALSRGVILDDEYLLKWLPDDLDEIENNSIDLVLLVRYAVCRLNHRQLYELLKTCKQKCSNNGVIFIELHNIEDILNGFNVLPIKERRSGTGIVCSWPSQKPSCSQRGWLFDLTVDIRCKDDLPLSFISTEYMFCYEDLNFMCQMLGLTIEIVPNNLIPDFNGSLMLMVRVKHD